jgi:hypothetical protein
LNDAQKEHNLNTTPNKCDHNQNDEFYDCYILGVYSDNMTEHKAEIIIQCYACSARLKMVLDGIFRLSVDDFWEGNIVSGMDQYEWPNMPMELLDHIYHGSPGDLKKEYPQVLDQIRDEKMILLHVTTSYGYEIMALCKSISVSELSR